jgi:hypothetical protein
MLAKVPLLRIYEHKLNATDRVKTPNAQDKKSKQHHPTEQQLHLPE